MIEIIREDNWDGTKEKTNLPKNIKQIGSPDIGDRIYIENQAYERMHPRGNMQEKTVFVMLGKFEEFGGRQCTFVESVIEMEEIQFDGSLPVWNDEAWAYLYRMLRHEYEDMVIAGWAIDIRGQLPNMTAPLESLHRTYFGGTHQILFLMDTLEEEEAFYSQKNGSLKKREGYYIYYGRRMELAAEPPQEDLKEAVPEEAESLDTQSSESADFLQEKEQKRDIKLEIPLRKKQEREQSYRNYVRQQQEEKPLMPSYASTFLLLAVIAALGFSAFRNYEKMNEMEETLSEMTTAQTMFALENTEGSSVEIEDINGSITKDTVIPGELGTENQENPQELLPNESETALGETEEQNPQAEGTEAQPQMETTQTMTEAEVYLAQGYYIVQSGDSLIGICSKIYQTTAKMDELCEVNGIDDPDAIYAGQYLTLPN